MKESSRSSRLLRGCLLLLVCALTCRASFAADPVETAGNVLQLVLPATAAGMTAYKRDGRGTLEMIESLGVAAAATYALKYSVVEARPNGGKHSFPSGHTSISFATAEFLRKRYGWPVGLPAYVVAAFVGYSRVESKAHYPRDVAAGAAIGFASSYVFTRPLHGWRVSAGAGEQGAWVAFARAWVTKAPARIGGEAPRPYFTVIFRTSFRTGRYSRSRSLFVRSASRSRSEAF